MDSIKQAVELARATENSLGQIPRAGLSEAQRLNPQDVHARDVHLNSAHLERSRIVAHGASAQHGHYYDMLRTQILQEIVVRISVDSSLMPSSNGICCSRSAENWQ